MPRATEELAAHWPGLAEENYSRRVRAAAHTGLAVAAAAAASNHRAG
jgi:hypothetical protein